MADDLNPEDLKLVTLARSTRARNGAAEGAAVRDDTGRTYAASTVALPSLQLSALQAAVVMAVASGARGIEAGAVVSEADQPAEADRAALSDLGAGAPLHLAGLDGALRGTA
ncbi:cytidine deaminase [Sporichthya sp.]|uniref:cytidine deaminase n=1 Tax=Sporichthya sp. TaxID=65475 RepID=UPI0017F909D2|nr:cytidine deaminase [Sporichthya sp.]MBA3745198.1 cytidine deaminase [Sporichthya sp.]